MSSLRSLCLAVVLVLAEFSGVVVAVDSQSLILSSPSSTYNYLPSAAVSSKNGSVLVAWAEWKSATDCQVWIAFCKPNGTAGYTAGKPKKISAAAAYNSFPEVVYHPDLDEFLVGWQAAEEDLQVVHEQLTSFMRVNAEGKLVGARIDRTMAEAKTAP